MIGNDIAAALPELRQQSESMLTDSCELQRVSGHTIDPDHGGRVDVWTAYRSVPCRLRDGTTLPSTQAAGAQELTGRRLTLAIPAGVGGVRVGDRAVLASGLTVYVRGVPRGSHSVLQRLDVTEDQTT